MPFHAGWKPHGNKAPEVPGLRAGRTDTSQLSGTNLSPFSQTPLGAEASLPSLARLSFQRTDYSWVSGRTRAPGGTRRVAGPCPTGRSEQRAPVLINANKVHECGDISCLPQGCSSSQGQGCVVLRFTHVPETGTSPLHTAASPKTHRSTGRLPQAGDPAAPNHPWRVPGGPQAPSLPPHPRTHLPGPLPQGKRRQLQPQHHPWPGAGPTTPLDL